MGSSRKQIEEEVAKLMEFKDETAGRRKVALQQEAQHKVVLAEEAVKNMAEAFAASSLSSCTDEERQALLKKLGALNTASNTKVDDARRFVQQRQQKREGDLTELAKLQARLNSLTVDLNKTKAAISEHEQKFIAKLLLQDIAVLENDAEAEYEKTKQIAATLTDEDGTEFILASLVRVIVAALTEYINKNSMTKEALFRGIEGVQDDKIGEEDRLLLCYVCVLLDRSVFLRCHSLLIVSSILFGTICVVVEVVACCLLFHTYCTHVFFTECLCSTRSPNSNVPKAERCPGPETTRVWSQAVCRMNRVASHESFERGCVFCCGRTVQYKPRFG